MARMFAVSIYKIYIHVVLSLRFISVERKKKSVYKYLRLCFKDLIIIITITTIIIIMIIIIIISA